MRYVWLVGALLVLGCDDGAEEGAADSGTDIASDVGTTGQMGEDAGTGQTLDADVPAPDADVPEPDADLPEPDAALPDAAPPDAALPARTPPATIEDFAPEDDEFIVVVLPDTQIYAQRFPETFDSQLRWIAENAEAYRIVFVSHVGDIVQTAGARNEWDVAAAAFDWLHDIDMPHGFSMGGHDTSWGFGGTSDSSCSPFDRTDCTHADFLEYFGPENYADRDWYAGSSPSGISSFQLVEVEGLRLLFLHLPQDVPAAEAEWANEVLDAHPGRLAHVTTHRYLFDYRLTDVLPPPLRFLKAGRFNQLTYTLGGQQLMFNTGVPVEELFSTVISPHPNVWGVHCGHVDAEFRQSMQNAAGLPVHEILADYQDMSDGGGGWLRLLKFKPSDNEVEVVSYSTTSDRIRENGEGFEHSLEILDAYKNAYAGELERFNLDLEELEMLLDLVRTEGSPERDEYYESLYGEGQRDSWFVLEVDFQAYIDASL